MFNVSINNKQVDKTILDKKTLIQVFEETVSKFGSKRALVFHEATMSYNELNGYSNRIAEHLNNLNIGKGSIVGIYLPRGFDLFIAILGVLKSGAAYVPFDKDTPIERVTSVLKELNTPFCFCSEELPHPLKTIIPFREIRDDTKDFDLSGTDDYAYIIFTSGSTGTPKGIPIKHYQITHLIRSENSILKINDEDIVYQGFSVSFDMWMEEVWISFLTGATLCIADAFTAKSFDTLQHFIINHKISVIHAVPGLLAMLNNDIPSLRIINSGGEACNTNVLKKWAKSPIQFFNSYGPTETTVSASIMQLHQDDDISIGFPLPNYSMSVVNEKMEPLPIGEQGEIIIAGPGLSDGYINKPELSKKVFLSKPDSLKELPGDRIYLTGDMGTMQEDGSFKITGRKDDQIKIRGYRVELGEIEAGINSLPFIKSAVVIARQVRNIDQLIAYILPVEDQFNEKIIRESLSRILPSYMIPNYYIKVDSFKLLSSGKINKKSLPDFVASEFEEKASPALLEGFSDNSLSKDIAAILSKSFPGASIHPSDDFFDDLGGHSMLAALFVSEVREIKGFENISILDIYEKRKIGEIINYWKENKYNRTDNRIDEFKTVPSLRYYTCWAAQTIALFFIYGLAGAQIFIPYLGYYVAVNEVEGHLIPILTAIVLFCVVTPLIILVTILCKKYIIGKFREGDYPLWGSYYFKWWLYKRLLGIIPVETISSTPLYPSFLKRVGLKVEADAQISKLDFGCADLISIGKNVTLSANVILSNAQVENGMLRLRSISIKDNAYIGTGSIVNGGCILETGSEMKDLSCLEAGKTIPANECWEGSPAKFSHIKPAVNLTRFIQKSKIRKYKFVFLALIITFPILIILPLVPSIIGLNYLDEIADWYSFTYLISTPLFSISYIILFILEVILLTKLFKNSLKVGTYSIYSTVYIKKWFTEQLFSLALYVIKPIFATLYITPIYRALGAKVGKNTEISNASNVTHHLLEIGSESFIADVAVIGESDIRNQELILKETKIGNKSFIGNSALIPQGYNLGDNKLIGVLSIPPPMEKISNDIPSDWFGSPAIQLPNREIRDIYPEHLTYKPSVLRKTIRGIVEFIRILIPQSIILSLSILFIAYTHDLLTDNGIETILLFFPFYYVGIVAVPAFLITLLIKWLSVGKYRKSEYPMWSWQVWRTEAITSIYEALAVPFFLQFLQGTPFLPMMFRLLGVKVGKKVWMDTTDITEFDMVSLGDNCALNADSGPQTHLFEDRVMKIGSVEIGSQTSIGSGSIILYNSRIEKNCNIGSLSLVMKGEHLPENTSWQGIPIQRK